VKRELSNDVVARIIATALFGVRVKNTDSDSLIYQIEDDNDVIYCFSNKVVELATQMFRSNPDLLLRSRVVGVLKEVNLVQIEKNIKETEMGMGEELDKVPPEGTDPESNTDAPLEGTDE